MCNYDLLHLVGEGPHVLPPFPPVTPPKDPRLAV